MDAVLFPYSLSMMPDPQLALANAGGYLSRDGAIHLVDFGDLEDWPPLPRVMVQRFLNHFSVYPRPAVIEEATDGMKLETHWRYRRYCFVGVLRGAA
jgi:S-adenosylmethionine-diacylgycerolhomoserine-N-methlytransferase